MKRRVFYYEDEKTADFAKTKLRRPKLDEQYKYLNKNKFLNFLSNILYYCLCIPILGLISIFMGVKVKNKKDIKKYKHLSLFIYANHTSYLDAFIIQTRIFNFKRTNIIGYSDATSIPIVKNIVKSAGLIPIPSTNKGMKNFIEAIKYLIDKGQNILIYPEAHIWPTYTKIREFDKTSFHYPAKFNVPILPIVTVYRKSKLSKKPKMTLVVGELITPNLDLSEFENKQYLHDECYNQMVKISNSFNQYRFNRFIKVNKELL